MKPILDKERAWERFLELHVEDEQSQEHMDAVQQYTELYAEDEDLAGFDEWVETLFADWFEGTESDMAYEQAEHRLD